MARGTINVFARRRVTRGLSAVVAVAVVVAGQGIVGAAPAPAQAAVPHPMPQVDRAVPGRDVPALPRRIPAMNSRLPAPVWPAARSAELVVDGAAVAGVPVRVASAGRSSPSRVRVEVRSRSATAAAGVDGLLLRVVTADRPAGRVRLSVDYSAFRYAYGADWDTRLRLVRMPAATPLPSSNDVPAGVVTAEVQLVAGDQIALAAAPAGAAGDYSATPVKPSSTWSAGDNTGDFTWSYPLRVPPGLGGPVPELGLSYSSGSVDGMVAASNNQPSWIGEGFGLTPGYVERKYKACKKDSGGSTAPKDGDLCWGTDNATLVLGEHSGELLKVSGEVSGTSTWRLRDDDGTRIQHLVSSQYAGTDGDNDGEHWVVTTTNGTQYWFGRNRLPGWASGKAETNATWAAPVYGNNSGEPCNASPGHCQQAWRWNLDYVVDPNGNTMSLWYQREKNSYLRAQATLTSYARGGWLDHIDYGTRSSTAYDAAPMQVLFGTGDRCLSDCTKHDGTHWPDTPWEMECTKTPCLVASPTFWSARRLASVTTRVGGKDVETWTLSHAFPSPGDGTRAGLWLEKLGHRGLVGTAVSLPDVTFVGEQLPNRVDAIDDRPPMNWWRIKTITTEMGGSINVDYYPQDCVKGSRMPASAHTNTLRCFPVRWIPDGRTTPIEDYFHKYVVKSVAESDVALPAAGRSPRTLTSYEYVGDPAWHFTDDDGLIDEKDKTWSVWRGYARVKTTVGDPGEQTSVEDLYFRGMNGDRLGPSGGTRTVSVSASDGSSVPDEDAYAGMVREEITYNGPGGPVIDATIYEPWRSAPTATRTVRDPSGDPFTAEARFTGIAVARHRIALDGGRGWRRTTRKTTFDPSYGVITSTEDLGDDAVAGDEKCSLTSYARNTTAWLVSYVSRVRAFAVDCAKAAGSGLTEADVISDTRTSYDQTAFGTAPTRGLISRVEELKGWPSTYLVTSRATHDAYGRVKQSWDVRGNLTTTTYTPDSGPVTQTVEENALRWTTTTVLEPAWALPLSVTDFNGKKTTLAYDALGRLAKVWRPGRATTDTPNSAYEYRIVNNAATAVVASNLTATGGTVQAYTLYDGLARTRQTQGPAPGGGRIVTDTFYDTAGRVTKTNDRYLANGDPSATLFLALSDPLIPAQTRLRYDGAGREVESTFLVKGVTRWRTATAYGGDRTDVTPPAGGTATSTVVDALGRTTALRQFHGPTPAGAADTTTYGYNRKDQLTAVTDPAGNQWTHEYDLLGRKTVTNDPDKGRSTTTYSDAGDITSTRDARDEVLAYVYDDIGRRISLHDDSANGPKRAEWSYDTLTNGAVVKGQLARSTRWVGADAYVQTVAGYDSGYRVTGRSITMPTVDGGGTYNYGYSYNVDGSVSTVGMPAVGDLPAETLSLGYTDQGLPKTLETSLSASGDRTFYVNGTGYTSFSEVATIGRRHNGGAWLDSAFFYEEGTRRPERILTKRETEPSLVSQLDYKYDEAGNVLKVAESPTADTQCFAYDHLRRLTEAWTPSSGDCGPAPTVAALGGVASYWQSFGYDLTGNRTTSTDHGTTDTTRTYTYPEAGRAQPHTLRSVTTTGPGAGRAEYGYDEVGNTTVRPGQRLTWDAEGRLATVTEAAGTSSYVYDTEGVRLVRRDPAGTTIYLPEGQELRIASGGAKTATRYYSHAGRTIAVRTAAGLAWQAGDHQGTSTISVDAVTQAVTIRRQKPFGQPRGAAVAWPGERGFVGGTMDNTGLTHLGAREYDPDTGRFVSVDPLIDVNDPQQLHGYAYANNSPVTSSDPDGLMIKNEGGRSSSGFNGCSAACSYYSQYYTEKVRSAGHSGGRSPFRGTGGRGSWSKRGDSTSCWLSIRGCGGKPRPKAPTTGPDKRYRSYEHNYVTCQSMDGQPGSCRKGRSVYHICGDIQCRDVETPDTKCANSAKCVFGKIYDLFGWIMLFAGPFSAAESGFAKWLANEVGNQIVEGVIGKAVEGASAGDKGQPRKPAGLNKSFEPYVLGWDTGLYQASQPYQGYGPKKPNPFYSPTVPDRTPSQTQASQVVFPRGTVVWEGEVNGQTVLVPQGRGSVVATWTLP